MLNFAVYIENTSEAKKTREILTCYLKNIKQSFNLITHNNADRLKKCIEENDTDIYIIDFSDVSKAELLTGRIRELNWECAIMIVNTSTNILKEHLYIRPSAYVEDINDENELTKRIKQMTSDIILKNRYFVFKCEGEIMRIPYDKISFFESNARKVKLSEFNKSSRYNFMAKLDDIQRKLPDNFLRCHQSYLVNMNHISKLDKNTHSFVLFNSQEVFISRRLYSEVIKRYEMYVLKRCNNTDFNKKFT